MNILYISRTFLPSDKTHTLSILRLCLAFREKGHNVILTGKTKSKNPVNVFQHYGIDEKFKIKSKYINSIFTSRYSIKFYLDSIILAFFNKKVINKYKPDIIYSRLTLFELFLVPRNIPIIYEMHGPGPIEKWYIKPFFIFLLRIKTFKKIATTNEMTANYLREYLINTKIEVIRLSIDEPIEISKEEALMFSRTQMKGENFKYHIGYTGNMDNYGLRGVDIIPKIASKMPHCFFHIVGGNKEMVEYHKSINDKYNVNNNIYFYGYRKQNEMPMFLANLDIVLAPLQLKKKKKFYYGMSPLKLPQYMSYGKAIVASDIPAHNEILKDSENALLAIDHDINSWVVAINKLIEDNVLKKHIELNAKQDYYKNHTQNVRVDKILS